MHTIRKLKIDVKTLFLILALPLITAGIAEATTRYAAPWGSGTTCSDNTPCSLTQGLSVTASGDTLYLKAGTYATGLQNPIPSGRSSSQPTILAGKPGDIAIIRPTTNVRPINLTDNRSNLTFRNLVLDGVNHKTSLEGFLISNSRIVNGLVLEDLEVKNFRRTAIVLGSDVTNSVVRRSRLHDSTGMDTTGGHCIYLRGSDNVIEHNECYNTWATGITMRTAPRANRNIIRHNTFKNNATNRAVTNGGRAINCSGPDNTIHNNIIISSNENGITATSGCKNVKIYNNTIYNNRGHGINMNGDASGEIRNNIIYLNSGSTIANVATGAFTISNNFTTDPLFVDPKNNNLSLKAGSLAIGKGAIVGVLETIVSTTTAPAAPNSLQATAR